MSVETKIVHFIKGMMSSNKRNDKKNMISAFKNDEVIADFLWWMYNPYVTFGITGKRALAIAPLGCAESADIFTLFRALTDRAITGNKALAAVHFYMNKAVESVLDSCAGQYTAEELFSLFSDVFDRNLKLGVDATTVNDVIPGLIPVFEVALAFDIKKNSKFKERIDKEPYLIMRKLDGVRCITVIRNHEIKFYSRTGNEFTSLSNLRNELQSFANVHDDCVLDGELCVIDDEGREDFKAAVSQIKRKNYTMENAHYKIFDFMTYNEFAGEKQSPPYYIRLTNAMKRFSGMSTAYSVIGAIRYTEENLAKAQVVVEKKGYEGLILRAAEMPYQRGRTSDLLKVKKFSSAEYVIEDILPTEMNMKNIDGTMSPVRCAGSLIIRHKGNPVGVGGGFTLEQRLEFLRNKDEYIGRTITVKFFEETKDAYGNPSLRFPIFVGFRDTLF